MPAEKYTCYVLGGRHNKQVNITEAKQQPHVLVMMIMRTNGN